MALFILFTDIPELSYYDTNKRGARGICLMINNVPNLKIEQKQLEDFFASLSFYVQVRRYLKMVDIYEVAREYAGQDHSRYDSFVFIVMSDCSHDHEISGVDRRRASVEQVMSEFKATNCPSLQNKPKLFFVLRFINSPSQHGDGHESSLEAHCCTDKAESAFSPNATTGGDACPEEADFLLTCVTSPVHGAQLVPGSLFIQVRI